MSTVASLPAPEPVFSVDEITDSDRVRLLLVGAGHAHLEIIRRQIITPHRRLEITVVSNDELHVYSGMVPGYLRGTYSLEEIAFRLDPLVRSCGGRFIRATATALDATNQIVHLDGVNSINYDLVSFNIGSLAMGQTDPRVAAHAAIVKPISQAAELKTRVEQLASEIRNKPARVVLVGAGAAGVEVATTIARRLDAASRGRHITLLDAAVRILAGYSERFQTRAVDILKRAGIALRTGQKAIGVTPEGVGLDDGSTIPSDLTVWLTGAAAIPMFEGSGLTCDARGFLLVDGALRSLDDPRVFAAGDCATLDQHRETPKAGVYAVRMGPALWESLVATVDGTRPIYYEPQRAFLSILNTGDGRALLRYENLISHSRWAWWLKDRIDRKFMLRYHALSAG